MNRTVAAPQPLRMAACVALWMGVALPVHPQEATTPLSLRASSRLENPIVGTEPPPTLRKAASTIVAQAAAAGVDGTSCAATDVLPQGILNLTSALELVLCRSPSMRQALANVREQSANVDVADLAWRPRFNLSLERASNRIPSSNSGSGSLSESVTGALGMSWVIFDFGLRSANLEQSKQALAAALASQDVATLTVIRDALRLYVDAAAAWARLDTMREAEALARHSAVAAKAKYEAQVAALSEKLQAETALAQATLDRVRAQGAWRAAASALAIGMGLPAASDLQLPDAKTSFPDLSDELPDAQTLALLREQHPRAMAIKADIAALGARLDSVKAEGRGSVSLSGSVAGTRQLGLPGANVDRSISTSLLASVPLFNRTEQNAREAQVLSQTMARAATLTNVQRDIDTALALAMQQIEIERQSQQAARSLVSTATQGYEVALGRYKAGVGAITELLGAQSALSNAQSQALQALIARANAQIGLAVAAGRLGGSYAPAIKK